MASLFITFRYIAFALFIIFSSIICILAAVNLGALQPHTANYPQIDVFLIFTGAFALVVIFPVIFTELIRKDAFVSRVIVEIAWLAVLWLMNIAGAAALIALSSEIRCFPTGTQPQMACSSSLALLTFSWLNTIIMLAYLLCLLVSSVYHAQDSDIIWHSSVRDFQWFVSQKQPPPAYSPRPPMRGPQLVVSTGRTRRSSNYARQIGLSQDYRVEPLRIRIPNLPQIATPPACLDLPAPPTPVAAYLSRVYSYDNNDNRANQGETRSSPIVAHTSTFSSLYPHHLQSTTAHTNPPNPSNGDSPPPAGEWPRKNLQEPSRPKHSKRRPRAHQSSDDFTNIHLTQHQHQQDRRARSSSRLAGPRTLAPRPRPAPLQVDIPR